MQSYTLTDARNHHGEIFDLAATEPVLLTKNARPSHVVLSARAYEAMLTKLQQLEDAHWGRQAEKALKTSRMMGGKKFTVTMERLARGKA